MCLYTLLIMLIKHAFCGNEYIAAKAYLYIIIAMPVAAFIFITILNIKMLLI